MNIRAKKNQTFVHYLSCQAVRRTGLLNFCYSRMIKGLGGGRYGLDLGGPGLGLDGWRIGLTFGLDYITDTYPSPSIRHATAASSSANSSSQTVPQTPEISISRRPSRSSPLPASLRPETATSSCNSHNNNNNLMCSAEMLKPQGQTVTYQNACN